jgi:subtilase family serine protease
MPVPPDGNKRYAHTNVMALIPAGTKPDEYPPFPGYGYETPASLGCVYFLVAYVGGCNPYTTKQSPTGGSKSIAIVDAYDDPSAPGDLAWFSLQFGFPLTLTQFQVVWANTNNSSCYYYGVPVDYSGGWEIEESLDVEWSHAMAPKAEIYLVEACSNFNDDLQIAVEVASNLVACGNTGIASDGTLTVCTTPTLDGEISMSWGEGEFLDESIANSGDTNCTYLDDSCFTMPGVVYFASSGDSPGVIWPGSSPNVVSAGGLSNRRSPFYLNFVQQSAWVYAGGGQSAVETQPSYQAIAKVQAVCGTKWRCVPDVSFDADPYTGVYVYDSFPIYGFVYGPWWVVGGTSVSSPSLAGIINNAATRSGTWAASSNAELTTIYSNLGTGYFTDIVSGYCGFYMGFTAVSGWDFCTGVGSPNTYGGK